MHPTPSVPTSIIPDTVLAGGLITAPAWGIWLMDVNQLLTTASLAVGLVLGCARLWQFVRSRRNRSPQN